MPGHERRPNEPTPIPPAAKESEPVKEHDSSEKSKHKEAEETVPEKKAPEDDEKVIRI